MVNGVKQGGVAPPGTKMQSVYDGYLVISQTNPDKVCNSDVMEAFANAEWWFTDNSCTDCYTSHTEGYYKVDVAKKKRTFTLGFHFDGDLDVDANSEKIEGVGVDKYTLWVKGLQEQGITEAQAWACLSNAKPANIFNGMNDGCNYSDCVGERILIW